MQTKRSVSGSILGTDKLLPVGQTRTAGLSNPAGQTLVQGVVKAGVDTSVSCVTTNRLYVQLMPLDGSIHKMCQVLGFISFITSDIISPNHSTPAVKILNLILACEPNVTLLMQLLDGDQPLHHLRYGSGHGVPLLHHIVQLGHLTEETQRVTPAPTVPVKS